MKKLILDGKKIKCVHEFVDKKRVGYIWSILVFLLSLVLGLKIITHITITLVLEAHIIQFLIAILLLSLTMYVSIPFISYEMASRTRDKITKSWLKKRESEIKPYLIYEEKMFEFLEEGRNSFTISKTAFGDLSLLFTSSNEYHFITMINELGYTLLYTKKNFVLIKNSDSGKIVAPWEFRKEGVPGESIQITDIECFIETSDVDLIKLRNQLRSISKHLFEIKWKKEYPEENFSYIVYKSKLDGKWTRCH